jgi:hypothetical protein
MISGLLKRSRNVIAREPLAVLSLSKDGDLKPFDYWSARLLRAVYPELCEGPAMTLKVALLAATVLVFSDVAFGLSDLDMREKRSSAINSARKNDCREENAEVRKLIDYAAALVFHNETEEASATLLTAAKLSKTPACREALEKIAGKL